MAGPSDIADLRPILLDPDRLVRAIGSGRRHGGEPPRWRKVELRPVDLAAGRRLQVVRYDERQAFTANLAYGTEARAAVEELLAAPYRNWHVDATDGTTQIRLTKKGRPLVHKSAAPHQPRTEHNRTKPALLDPDDKVLRAVGITTASGAVKPSRQGKLRQVEAFLRNLDPVLEAAAGRTPEAVLANGAVAPLDRPIRVVDLGCGNAYLTFAAYRFLTAHRGLPATLIGVDVKAPARERNTKLAAELGWASPPANGPAPVTFVEGTIAAAPVDSADIVFALHACDTATDDALARGVRWQAPLILAAPCCHHELHSQMRHRDTPAPYKLITRHGILRERFADVLTDTLRAAILRLLGYRVDVIEFVPTRHTPRNVLIRAVHTGAPPDPRAIADYAVLLEEWRVRPRLAVLLADRLNELVG